MRERITALQDALEDVANVFLCSSCKARVNAYVDAALKRDTETEQQEAEEMRIYFDD
jgi:hypothetical protein